jgi:hypothetical protein
VTPRNSTATRREESPISKCQHLRDPNRYPCRCSGATVRDNHRGPLKNRGKPTFSRKNTNINKFASPKHAQHNRAWWPQRPTKTISPGTLERNSASLEGRSTALTKLCLARGPVAPSSEVPPRSRAERPLGRGLPRSRARCPLGRGPPRSRVGRPLG